VRCSGSASKRAMRAIIVGRDLSTEREGAQRAASLTLARLQRRSWSYPSIRLLIGPTLVVADVLFGRRSIAALSQGGAGLKAEELTWVRAGPKLTGRLTATPASTSISPIERRRMRRHRNGVVRHPNAYQLLTGSLLGLGLPILSLKSLRNLVGAAGFEPAT
jgi:hypothetical protein